VAVPGRFRAISRLRRRPDLGVAVAWRWGWTGCPDFATVVSHPFSSDASLLETSLPETSLLETSCVSSTLVRRM
jgi:hypothetical protein